MGTIPKDTTAPTVAIPAITPVEVAAAVAEVAVTLAVEVAVVLAELADEPVGGAGSGVETLEEDWELFRLSMSWLELELLDVLEELLEVNVSGQLKFSGVLFKISFPRYSSATNI